MSETIFISYAYWPEGDSVPRKTSARSSVASYYGDADVTVLSWQRYDT